MKRIFQKLEEIAEKGETAALCIITDTSGSTPLKAGAKMIVWKSGEIFGSVGGGNLEHQVIKDAKEVMEDCLPQVFEYNLVKDYKMCCGGTVKIFIEPVIKMNKLLIFGAGHIGKQVAKFAEPLNFHITVIDEREDMIRNIENKETLVCHMHHREFLSGVKFDEQTYIIICTHLHEYDREILAYCIQKPSAYLGMIGSRRKVFVTRKLFLQNGIATEEELSKIDMPMGFDIGSTSPEEIGISIVAKLVAVKNRVAGIDTFNQTENYAEKNSDSNGCW